MVKINYGHVKKSRSKERTTWSLKIIYCCALVGIQMRLRVAAEEKEDTDSKKVC